MDVENPLQADVLHVIDIEMPNAKEIISTSAIPIAKCMEGEPSTERDSSSEIDFTNSKKICFFLELTAIMFIGLAFLGGFILFLAWLYNPCVFGSY